MMNSLIINQEIKVKKFFLILPALLLCVCSAKAESLLPRWEGEIFAGPNVAIGTNENVNYFFSAEESKPLMGYSLGAEFRRNFEKLPIDLGLRFSFSKIGYNLRYRAYEYSPEYWQRDYNNSFTFAAVGDWIFNRRGAVSPFIGAGIGLALNESYFSNAHFLVMPRIGVSIKNRFRVAVSANFTNGSHDAALLSVGYVFGVPLKSGRSSGNNNANAVYIPADINRLIRQSNACLWTGVGALCVGLPTLTIGIIILANSNYEGAGVIGGIITGAGGLFTLSSIPLFIISHYKRNEALRMSLNMTSLYQPGQTGTSQTPALGLSIAF